MTTRPLVFISHANPEDNEFTRWLGLVLVRNGYQVWSDITKLIGGEVWWNDIEEAIREHTAKFLFVLSRSSNGKPGVRNELHLALNVERSQQLRDFVVPLLIDPDFSFGDINIQIANRNAVPFVKGWAGGLALVLEKLEQDGVPRNPQELGPAAVTKWWRAYADGSGILRDAPSVLPSNWFPITGLPEDVHIYHLENRKWDDEQGLVPAHRIASYVISFASARELGLDGCRVDSVPTRSALAKTVTQVPLYPDSLRFAIVRLLRLAWSKAICEAGLPVHTLASGHAAGYFSDSALQDGARVSFDIPGTGTGRRALAGRYRKARWHYAVSGDVVVEPAPSVVVRSHVLFSDDGESVWQSTSRLHSARRSACSMWWNARWRDMLLAAMSWIARRDGSGNGDSISLPLGTGHRAVIGIAPWLFTSPVTYSESDIEQHAIDESDWDGVDEASVDVGAGGDDEN